MVLEPIYYEAIDEVFNYAPIFIKRHKKEFVPMALLGYNKPLIDLDKEIGKQVVIVNGTEGETVEKTKKLLSYKLFYLIPNIIFTAEKGKTINLEDVYVPDLTQLRNCFPEKLIWLLSKEDGKEIKDKMVKIYLSLYSIFNVNSY